MGRNSCRLPALAVLAVLSVACSSGVEQSSPRQASLEGCADAAPDAPPEPVTTVEPPAAGPVEAPPPITDELLSSCPDGETWFRAFREPLQAPVEERAERMRHLGRIAVRVSTEHPERWEPVWAVAESRLWVDATPSDERLRACPEAYGRARQLALAAGDPLGIAGSANRIARCLKRLKQAEPAEAAYLEGLAAAREAANDRLEASMSNGLAGLYQSTGDFSKAIDTIQRTVEILKRLGEARSARLVSYNWATLLENVGNTSEARKVAEQVYDEALAADSAREIARIALVLGNLHLLVDALDEAAIWYARVSEDYPRQAAGADLGRGRLTLKQGRLEEAARILDRAAGSDVPTDVPLFAEYFRAEVDLRAGRPEIAERRIAVVIEKADRQKVKQISRMARTLLGKIRMLDPDRYPDAEELFREAIEIIENRGAGLDLAEEGRAYLRGRLEPYAELAAVLALQHGDAGADEIIEVVERAHARALRAALEGVAAFSISDLASLQSGLAPGDLLLDFLIGEDRGVVIAIASGRVQVAVLPGWSELRRPIQRYIEALKRPLVSAEARLDPAADLERALDQGRRLRGLLLDPVAGMLEQARRLYVIPDQDLALLPFAALPFDAAGDGAAPRFLGAEKEIGVMPMAGLPPDWSGPRTPLLLAGDPTPDPAGEFGELPLAEEELSRVERVWRGADSTRLDREQLASGCLRHLALEEFNTLHFATHAVASSTDPDRCAVILSAGEKLGTEAIVDLPLGEPLIVLSACQTGGGEIVPGEGVVGLSWAFLQAGAKGITASLWSVEDSSTAELMVAFHEQLKSGDDPVRALALAQQSLIRAGAHPAYWAPFVTILRPTD